MFLSLLIILIIVLIAGAFFLAPENPGDGNPALLQGLSQIRSLAEEAGEEEPKSATIYKWQDANGEWHFSNTPPPAGVASQVKTYRTDANVIQATRTPPADKAGPPPAARQATAPLIPDIPGLPSPDTVKKLTDDARAVQELSRNRTQILDQQIDAND